MKILYVVTDLAMGGAEIQVLRMIEYLRKRGEDIIYLSMVSSTDEQMISTLRDNGVTYLSLNMSPGKAKLENLIQFTSLVKKIKPDIIHAHMVHANFLTRVAAPFINTKIIINTIHGEEEFLGRRKKVYQLSDFLVNYTVCCGNSLYRKAKREKIVSEKRLRVVTNGINLNAYSSNYEMRLKYRKEYGVSESQFIWMTVGRLEKVKNYCYLIEEFSKLCEKYNCIHLFFVGDGSERKNLKAYVKKLGLENKIIFLGKRNDVVELLNMCDAFVLSSLHEGLPLSLQEAAAMSKPLVCTDVGGCCEVVRNNENGFLCNVNETGALKDAMEKIMNLSDEDYVKYCDNSRKKVEDKFSIDQTMKTWMKLYTR